MMHCVEDFVVNKALFPILSDSMLTSTYQLGIIIIFCNEVLPNKKVLHKFLSC
jgi:hypothetical protein